MNKAVNNPSQATRRILLCVTGLSPQVVTETLYALALQHDFMPHEIHLITTQNGAERARLTLLSDEPGWLGRLLHEYDLPAVASTQIHVLQGAAAHALNDIRTLSDNEAAANQITEIVRQLTVDPASAVHASIAGGRKTMGFYLGYAMSLFGRSQDRLSHVLVSSPFESNQNFYYPSQSTRIIYTPTPDQQPLDTKDAVVTLADIPFVRMRDGLNDVIRNGEASFSGAVAQAQRALGPAELVLDAATRNISCGGVNLTLAPVDFAFYAWFARRAQQQQEGFCRNDISAEETAEFVAGYPKADDLSGGYERVANAVGEAMTTDYFDQRRSRVNRVLVSALGKVAAAPYRIIGSGKRPRTHYRIELPPERVRFDEIPGSKQESPCNA